MKEEKKLGPIELTRLFNMMVAVTVDNTELMPCEVNLAKLQDGGDFFRVIAWKDDEGRELIIDVDHDEKMGWYDVYDGCPSVWSEMVADALDYHKAPYARTKK